MANNLGYAKSTAMKWRAEHGMGAVALAFIIPIFLMLTMGALELFLYFRAVSVVQRAAAEAAQALSAASPGGGKYTQNSLSATSAVTAVAIDSGGSDATASSGELAFYAPAGADFAKHQLPFSLSDSVLPNVKGNQFSDWKSGVMYLPFVSVPTCLEPLNEGSHASTDCGDDTSLALPSNPYLQFLTYQLPTRIDFDGDGLEDLAFFYYNATGDDWWIIPSSSGGLFRDALALGMNEETISVGLNWLPCPADYDGDSVTDLCTTAISDSDRKIYVNISFSKQFFHVTHNFSLVGEKAETILPVPGAWDSDGKDRFAIVYATSADSSTNLTTAVWPAVTDSETTQPSNSRFTLADSPTTFNKAKYKPEPGKMWRPAFGTHDGTAPLKIGWLTWQGGYRTSLIAGTGVAGTTSTSDGAVTATNAALAPWALEYGVSGLYVVEQQNHVISLITPGANNRLRGDGDSEQYVIIAGIPPDSADYDLVKPDPLSKGLFSPGGVPTEEGDVGCDDCYIGGGFNSDEKPANQARLNQPRDVSVATSALFIADFGNWRVRVVKPGATANDLFIDGSNDEMMYTEVGGTPSFNCDNLHGMGPVRGDPSWTWDQWTTALPSVLDDGVHPRCVALRPTAVYYDANSENLFVGDENGRVFVVGIGDDSLINAWDDQSERLKLVMGATSGVQWNSSMPTAGANARSQGYGIPTAITSYNSQLAVLLRSASLPPVGPTSTGPINAGGAITLGQGADRTWGTSDDIVKADSPIVGAWDATNNGPSAFGNPTTSTGGDLRNPADIATYTLNYSSKSYVGAFVTDWWMDSSSDSYEHALLHFYNSAPQPTPQIRWLNRIHSNSWGLLPPTTPQGNWTYSQLNWNANVPLASAPVAPSAGVAISSDGRYLYVSQTQQGIIFSIALDYDSDGLLDLPNPASVADIDLDSDGDEKANSADKFPFHFQTSDSSTESVRSFDTYQDPMMWATGIDAQSVTLTDGTVDRMEWWLDRITQVSPVPLATPEQVPAQEEPLFTTFGQNTIVAPNGRGAIHHTPVWEGGPNRENEKKLLAPIVLTDGKPNGFEIKDISGYDQCTDFKVNELSSATTLLATGEPATACDRDLTAAQYQDGRTVGTRRAHLAHWTGNWHPVADEDGSEEAVFFLDWDGDGLRNPAVVNSSSATSAYYPLEVYIGNLGSRIEGEDVDPCPNSFAMGDLQELGPQLSSFPESYGFDFGFTFPSTLPQMKCDSANFFTWEPVPYVRILANYRAEWQINRNITTANFAGTTSQRLISDDDSSSDQTPGPISETAYQVLERSLSVASRGSTLNIHDAQVLIQKDDNNREATVTVSYVLPVLKILKPIIGAQTTVVTSSVTQRIYGFGEYEQ